jgi:hypothetical protein
MFNNVLSIRINALGGSRTKEISMSQGQDKHKENSLGKLKYFHSNQEHGGLGIRDPSLMNLSPG